MYFLRVDFSYDHHGVTVTRDLVDDEFAALRELKQLAKDPHVTILSVKLELCR